jgi:predicted GTPase
MTQNIFKNVEAKAVELKMMWVDFCNLLTQNLEKTFIDLEKTSGSEGMPEKYLTGDRGNLDKSFLFELRDLKNVVTNETQELSRKLEEELERLIWQLSNPTLTIATTGTTSSGKSTLINMLCGLNILPSSRQEMSAGAVTIKHSDSVLLTIEKTHNAKWKCDTWGDDISIDDINAKLEEVMTSYRNTNNPQVASPKFEIYCPIRLVNDNVLNLPEGTRIQILDLPGLSSISDEKNREVIQEECKKALCLVTYDSGETDKAKKNKLLSEVVNQIQILGGSPARMLFVLNKIDLLKKDGKQKEQEFIDETENSIKSELEKEFPEYRKEILALETVKFSSEPALLAIQIQKGNRDKNEVDVRKAYRAIDGEYKFLLSDELRDDLGGINTWQDKDKARILEEIVTSSYSKEFHAKLKNHIEKYFPQLVIPQMIEKFNDEAANAISQWSVQTTSAILSLLTSGKNGSIERIEGIKISLNVLLSSSILSLKAPFNKVKQSENKIDELQKVIASLEILEGDFQDLFKSVKLEPLYSWQATLHKLRDKLLEVVTEYFTLGISLETRSDLNPLLEYIRKDELKALETNLERLKNLGYIGATKELNNPSKDTRKAWEDNLNSLKIALESTAQKIIQRKLNLDKGRIIDSLKSLYDGYIDCLEKAVNDQAPELGIKLSKSALSVTISELTVEVVFSENIKTEKTNRQFLWFKWQDEKLIICDMDTFRKDWKNSLSKSENEVALVMVEWIIENLDNLNDKASNSLSDAVKNYEMNLNRWKSTIGDTFDENIDSWKELDKSAKKLSSQINLLKSKVIYEDTNSC